VENAERPRLIEMQVVSDQRGGMLVCDGFPFEARRFFVIHGHRMSGVARGGHAHREQHQLLTCLLGSVDVVAERDGRREQFTLYGQPRALYLPPMTWVDLTVGRGAALLVLASAEYDEADYIRDRDAWLQRQPLP
jgi:dTDP-4-dehydrorhamnose 3,5-epimerase-like enzyme